MGKNKNNRQNPSTSRSGPQSAPVSPSGLPTPEPTPAQLAKLPELERAAEALAAPPQPAPPATNATLAALLERAQGLVNGLTLAREHLASEEAAAQKRSKDAASEAQRQREQLAEQRAQTDQDRQFLLGEQRAHGELGRALQAREQAFITREAEILARENEADAGFLAQRRALLGDLKKVVEALQRERAELIDELAEARRAAQAERTQLDEAQAARHRGEDDERARTADRLRQDLTVELRQERARRLAELAREEKDRRAAAEAELDKTHAAYQSQLDEARAALERERRLFAGEQTKLRAERSELAAHRELYDEDVRMLDVKVARLAAARVADLEAELAARVAERDAARRARDAHHAAIMAREQLEHRLDGRRPEDLLEQLAGLEQRNRELHAELGHRLGEEAGQRLASLEHEQLLWREEKSVLRAQLAEATHRVGQSRIAAVELEMVRKHREVLETRNKLLDAALAELQAQVDKYTQSDGERNPLAALCALDERDDCKHEINTWNPIGGAVRDLQDFAVDLRHRIASAIPGRPLYYSERDIRCFLGGLAMSNLMLLQGISGTGKTSLPREFAKAIGAGVEVIEVQAGWRDRQDLIGYFNAFHRHYYATNFLQALYRAGTPGYAGRPFLIILDEINLSRVEQFFADFLSALEQPESDRQITLLADPIQEPPRLIVDGRHLPIPPNVWFIGTANHDETTTEFADKTYDRAHIMELPRRDPARDEFAVECRPERHPIDYQKLQAAFSAAADAHKGEVERVHGWLRDPGGIAPLLERRFRVGWGHRLEGQIRRFLPVVRAAGGTTGEALDHLLHTRVLRKLRDRHDVRHKALEEFRDRFVQAWQRLDPDSHPERSLDLLTRELHTKHDEEAA